MSKARRVDIFDRFHRMHMGEEPGLGLLLRYMESKIRRLNLSRDDIREVAWFAAWRIEERAREARQATLQKRHSRARRKARR